MASKKLIPSLYRKFCNWFPPQTKKAILSQEAYNKFQNSLSVIIDKGVTQVNLLESVELQDRTKRVAEYYISGRNTIQGELTILSHEVLRKHDEVKGELLNQQYVLAWCVELVLSQILIFSDLAIQAHLKNPHCAMFQLMSYILIIDDIEDGAKNRCGKPCWHLLPDVGTLAINDANMLRSFIMELLRQNFKNSTFIKLENLFNQAFYTCNVGQYMDAIASKNRKYDVFTMKHYKKIALYKYAYYSSKFPILSALILSNKFDKNSCQNVDSIFTDVGIWSQINNDFTDFYDDDTRTSKTGSDIQAGKCTWLAVKALQLSNETERKEFEKNYGSWEPTKVERIRKLYYDLNLTDLYFKEQDSTYEKVVKKIESLPANSNPSPRFFHYIFEKYYPNVTCNTSFQLKPIIT